MFDQCDAFFCVIILGDANVGKTSIFRRYIYNEFEQDKKIYGSSFFVKDLVLNCKEDAKDEQNIENDSDTNIIRVKVQLWDIAVKQSLYNHIELQNSSTGIIVAYDI